MKGAFRYFLLVISLLFVGAAFARPVVEDIRLSVDKNTTRIVLDLSQSTKYNIFSLRGPDRIAIDLDNGEIGNRLANLQTLPGGVGSVANIRSSIQPDGKLRVVLDVSGPMRMRSFLAGPSANYADRLVIDLAPQDSSSSVQRASDTRRTERDIIVAIDPGHGGRDPGAIGRGKTKEKDVTLAIGRQLAAKINAEPGMKAILIRDGDYLIDLRERMEKARRQKADLFISIHADAVEDRRATGASVYRLSTNGASSEGARRLAARENSAGYVGGVILAEQEPVVAKVLMDLSQGYALEKSDKLGQKVLDELSTITKVHRNKVQNASFMVLKSPDIPSILVETAYISNPGEEAKLRNKDYQRKLASAILNGMRGYLRGNPIDETLVAANNRKQPASPVKHVISSGDTLSEIAERYSVSVAAIRNENNLRGNRIRIGQTLKIPVMAGS
jgi:N-acetylmuramoyl-L-alanine amidase